MKVRVCKTDDGSFDLFVERKSALKRFSGRKRGVPQGNVHSELEKLILEARKEDDEQ